VAIVASEARYHYRYVRAAEPNLKQQAKEVYDKAKENFPDDEWKAFWGKLVTASGQSQDDLKAKLKANNYNMDMTVEEVGAQLKNKAQEYPALNQQYNRIKAQFQSNAENMRGQSLTELFAQFKTFLESKFGPIDPNTIKEKLPDYLAAIFAGRRRHRRETVDNLREQFITQWEQKFPKAEFDAFLQALGSKAKVSTADIKKKLEANKGNMDLTVEELMNKAKGEYPDEHNNLQTQYNMLKTKFDQAYDNMDETSLNDLLEKSKTFLKQKFPDFDVSQAQDNFKNWLATIFTNARRHRREVPAEVKPHIEEFKRQFGDKFPKNEWDSFYAKFKEFMSTAGKDAQTELTKHQGNMDLTIEEAKDKAFMQYPQIKQQWQRVKAKMDQSIDNADETTIRDFFNFVKTHAEQTLGKPITEDTVKEFTGNMQAYLTTFFSQMSSRYW
jgi:hypothetical protein